MRSVFNLDGLAIGCVVIAGVTEAVEQALKDSPNVVARLPSFAVGPTLNYVPLGLLLLAGALWFWKQLRAPAKADTTATATQSEPVTASAVAIITPDGLYRHGERIKRTFADFDAAYSRLSERWSRYARMSTAGPLLASLEQVDAAVSKSPTQEEIENLKRQLQTDAEELRRLLAFMFPD